MIEGKILENYCDLVLKIGVNLQKGQGLYIVCPVEKSFIAHALAKKAYCYGASFVSVNYEDENLDKINFENASVETLSAIPKWKVDSKNYLIKENYCYVAISAENPSAFAGVDPNKISAYIKAKGKAFKKYSDAIMNNAIRWCVISYPTLEWAKQIFPNSSDPEKDLSVAIENSMRLNGKNPLKDWKKHLSVLEKHAKFLNEHCFSALHFKNSIGTDLNVGLAEDHLWLSAKEKAQDGVDFIANLPTEEVFTAPHRDRVDGVLKSALPLSLNGNIIEDFTIKFCKGKIVDYSAKKGYDILKNLIETDEGTHRLGEVALIGKNSPIAKSGILFFNTLFDENASCHLAIGKAYPTTIKKGSLMSLKELLKKGANDSKEHIDFMIGTEDLTVTGIDKNGNETPIFIDGEWAI